MKLEAFLPYLEEHKAAIERGEPITIQVIDRDIFEEKVVKALVSKSRDAFPDGEDLWVKDDREEICPVPWRIKILEETTDIWTRRPRGLSIGG